MEGAEVLGFGAFLALGRASRNNSFKKLPVEVEMKLTWRCA